MEAADEIRNTGILKHLTPEICLHSDGARSWQKLAKELRCSHAHVVHAKMQFVKTLRQTSGNQKRLVGTQLIDSSWKCLKAYVPSTVHTKNHGKLNFARLMLYINSWVWRRNQTKDLWSALGKLCHKSMR